MAARGRGRRATMPAPAAAIATFAWTSASGARSRSATTTSTSRPSCGSGSKAARCREKSLIDRPCAADNRGAMGVARLPRPARAAFAVVAAWLTLHELHAVLAPHLDAGPLFSRYAHDLVLLSASALTIAGALRKRG